MPEWARCIYVNYIKKGGVVDDTAMRYDANKKSIGVAYALWLFLGGFGAHRFYLKKKKTAIILLIATIVGALTSLLGVGVFILAAVGVWVLVDAFLIPSWNRDYNNQVIDQLTSG
jgi:TM2 domain-containing membrane protein YozV